MTGRASTGAAAKDGITVRGVRVSHPDKVLWPDEGITKLDIVRFYDEIFTHLAPYVRGRLLSLERCPEGIRGGCFYQKQKPAGLPPGTPSMSIRHASRTTDYVVGGRRDTQLALANLGCIAVHVWGSRAVAPRRPDWICFDLDPASGQFADAVRAAKHVRRALDELGLGSFPKTSGGKGLHVFVPIRSGPDTDEVLRLCAEIGQRLAAAYPAELTVEPRIANRGDRVYLDAFRNAYAQTVVTPYSVRVKPQAPVSTPLDWSEVTPTLDPRRFNVRTFDKRISGPDPWESFFKRRQSVARILTAVNSPSSAQRPR